MNRDMGYTADIQVNPQQKLAETLDILRNAGRLPQGLWGAGTRIRSLRRKVFIPAEETYEQANIYTGDILELITDRLGEK